MLTQHDTLSSCKQKQKHVCFRQSQRVKEYRYYDILWSFLYLINSLNLCKPQLIVSHRYFLTQSVRSFNQISHWL